VKRALITAALAIGALVAVAGALMAGGWWAPWAEHYVQGIDVSQHQGAIDWRTVARTDIRFAYIKATEGGGHRDSRFDANWRGAARAGLKRGAYHYFTLCRSGREQAANFIEAVPVDPDALPPAVDLEHMGPCRRGPPVADVAGEISRYADDIQIHYGARPIFYTTDRFDAAYLRGRFASERFWVRSLFTWPGFRRQSWVIWQRDNGARRPGVPAPVDVNSFRGDAAAFDAFAGLTEKST
jgi:lysozyme